jgi:hypothetical protein
MSDEVMLNQPKQPALTMFLCRCDAFVPETYHMIEQCDKSIADWAPTGDSFIIKDIDSFTKVE